MSRSIGLLWLMIILAATSSTVCAAASSGSDEANVPAAQAADVPWAKAVAIVGACFGAGLAAIGGGYGISRIGGACIESIARQPEAGGAMFAPMVIAAAMVEGGMLFAIVVCLLGVLFI